MYVFISVALLPQSNIYKKKTNSFHVDMICSVIDHRWCQKVVRVSMAHESQVSVSLMFLPRFDIQYANNRVRT